MFFESGLQIASPVPAPTLGELPQKFGTSNWTPYIRSHACSFSLRMFHKNKGFPITYLLHIRLGSKSNL